MTFLRFYTLLYKDKFEAKSSVVRPGAFQRILMCVWLLLLPFCMAVADVNRRFTLVIDAGHGGHDAGAVGSFSKEKNINLNVALAFGRLVEENCPDVKVVYTRRTDVFISLQRRADIANDNKADLFISIHTNALPAGKIAYGSETYTLGMARANENLAVAKRENSVITLENDYKRTYQGFDPNKAESYVIFEIMQDKYMTRSVELAKQIQKQYKSAGRPNKGVHQAGFLVLRNTSMPSVLTELGFITTPQEEQYLNSQRGISELSRSIYNGFLAYRRIYDKTAQSLPKNLSVEAVESTPANVPVQREEAKSDEVAVVPVDVVPTAQLQEQSKEPVENVVSKKNNVKAQDDKNTSKRETKSNESVRNSKKKVNDSATETKKNAQKPTAKSKESAKTSSAKTDTKSEKGKQQTDNSKSSTTKKKTDSTSKKTEKTPRIKYRIQVGAGKNELPTNDKQFKGLNVQRVKEGTLYKYFYGTYTTFSEAQKGLKTAKEKVPASYIVAYVDGKSVSVAEARAQEKKK